MKVIYFKWPCLGEEGILKFFKEQNYKVTIFEHQDMHETRSPEFFCAFNEAVDAAGGVDFVFSYNYYPILAKCCNEANIKYISVVYDMPQVKLYSFTAMYETNYIFHFDSEVVAKFRAGGLTNFYYCPLPVDAELYDEKLAGACNEERLSADVSFVGSLYNEDHNFYDRMKHLSERNRGYLEGIMAAQSQVYGYNFMDKLVTEDILSEAKIDLPYVPNPESADTFEWMFTNYCLERKLTSIERIKFLSKIAEDHSLKVFSHPGGTPIAGAQMMGIAEYHNEMPFVFNRSRINLNISLRSIHNGIPLRCLDIMACGGFLLSNYQYDLCEAFTAGEDFEYFDSEEDLVNKIDYYLAHEDERAQIAANGRQKCRLYYSYKELLPKMLEIAGVK